MKAKVKKTNKTIEVVDYGEKFHPRFWNKAKGYNAGELEFQEEV